jgi:hypothetical protein
MAVLTLPERLALVFLAACAVGWALGWVFGHVGTVPRPWPCERLRRR